MADTWAKNADWPISPHAFNPSDSSAAQLAVLMDIRGELQNLVRIFQGIPAQLEASKPREKNPVRGRPER
jgi:hypothetical protein